MVEQRAWSGVVPHEEVEHDDEEIRCVDALGATRTMSWTALREVGFYTTDDDSFVEDVFLVLIDEEGVVTLPQEAPGASALIERLVGLPGFDHTAMVRAMDATTALALRCWSRGR